MKKQNILFFFFIIFFLHKNVMGMELLGKDFLLNRVYKHEKRVILGVLAPFWETACNTACKAKKTCENMRDAALAPLCFENPREDYQCLICFENFKNYREIFVLPCACKHPLCFKCIKEIARCPFCRGEYQAGQVEKKLFKKIGIKKLQENEQDITEGELRTIGYCKTEIESLEKN